MWQRGTKPTQAAAEALSRYLAATHDARPGPLLPKRRQIIDDVLAALEAVNDGGGAS
jgi:hypothetical protein